MMMDYITIAGYTFAVFGAGVAIGKLVEKIERLDRKTENKDKHICKNNRHLIPWIDAERKVILKKVEFFCII